MALVISFMGVDGSGKSTLANALAKSLEAKGQESIVVWATLRPVLLKPFIKAAKYLLVRKHNKFSDYDNHIEVKRKGMKKLSWTHSILFFVMIIDYLPQAFYKVTFQKLLGKNVICDRYYFDLIVDYGAHINAPIDRVIDILNKVGFIFTAPDLNYFLKVSPEIAFNRKDDIPSLDYLIERDTAYTNIIDNVYGKVLDGSKEISENVLIIQDDINNIIEKSQ